MLHIVRLIEHRFGAGTANRAARLLVVASLVLLLCGLLAAGYATR